MTDDFSTNFVKLEPAHCIKLCSPPMEEIIRLDKEGFHYRGQFIADAGEAHRLMVEFLRQQTQPEPQGPPKNCWLDDEPDLCPSPCVFDDPSEVIENCVYARTVKCKTDCKYYRTTQQPEPQGPTDEELESFLVDVACQNGNMYHAEPMTLARAVLARWRRPAIEPVPVAERLPGPEDLTDEHFGVEWCWWGKRFAGGWEWHQGGTGYGTMPGEFSYWLPHHALPVPQQEADRG